MTKISISLAQLNIQLGEPEKNLQKAIEMVQTAAKGGSRVILFPEIWNTGYDLKNAAIHAKNNQFLTGELARYSRENQIAIGGSIIEGESGRLYNTFYLFTPDGNPPVTYRKVHLFRLMNEDRWLSPGNCSQTLETGWAKAGMAICYDLRFPELFRKYALEDCRIIYLVSEWPKIRISHWKTLLRARAIENQYFIAAVNAVGVIGKENFGGSSAIISPWGEVITEGNETDESLLTGEITPADVDEVRATIPVFGDRRPDVYG